MFIRYKNKKYKCNFIDKFILIWIKFKLSIKRSVRLFRIMIPKRDIILYIFIIFLWLLWGVISNIVDAQFKHEHESYAFTLWGLRNSIFSSVILTFAIGAFNHLNVYRKIIKRQHYLYVDIMDSFEEIIKNGTSSSIWSKFNFMFNIQCFEEGMKYLRDKEALIDIDLDFCTSVDAIEERITMIEQEIKMGNLIVKDENIMNTYLYKAKRQIPKIMQRENIPELEKLLELLFKIIEQLRYIWRKDVKDDLRIISILSKYEANKIKDDFYKRMILLDFNIDSLEL